MSRHLASIAAVALCCPALLAPSVPTCPDCGDLAIVGVDSPNEDLVRVTVKNVSSAKSLGWLDLYVDTGTAPVPGDKVVATRAVETLLPGEVVILSFDVEAKWEAFVLLDEGSACVGSCLDANLAAVFDIRTDAPEYSIDSVVPGYPGCPTCK